MLRARWRPVKRARAIAQYEDGRVVLRGAAEPIHAATDGTDQPGPGWKYWMSQ